MKIQPMEKEVPMQAVALNGFKNSGKTSLAFQLCQHFQAQGIKVAVAKYSSHGFDAQDTDTQTLSRYATTVFGLSRDQTEIIWKTKKYLPDLIGLTDAQVLIVEGGKSLHYLPKVILSESEQEIRQLDTGLTLAVWGEQHLADLTVTKDLETLADLILDKGFFLPGLDCQACGRKDCSVLAGEILRGTARFNECLALQSSLKLSINGRQLPINPFVNAVLANGIKGLLSPLKGFGPGLIEISLES